MPDAAPVSETPAPIAGVQGGWRACWLAETLRLRENLWGPLEDASEVRRVRAEGGSFTERLLKRAHYLAAHHGLDQTLARWSAMARLALIIMAVLALLAGAATALGALGDGSRSVNIILALVSLLGLNTLTFTLWLISFALPAGSGGSWLGECWLWLTRKLARGPDAALAPRALIELLSRQRALRWALGGISHGVWTLALTSAVLTMLAVLSARRYGFNWETTLLTPDTFVSLAGALGWLPAQLGFAMPSPDIIRASDGLQNLPETAQALWSSWLIGCVLVYGLLPRAAALLLSVLITRARMSSLQLDTRLPGYAELQDRLAPASERTRIDQDEGDYLHATLDAASSVSTPTRRGQPVLVGLELAPYVPWPPPGLSPAVANLGVIDSGAQRKTLLDRLEHIRPVRLLLICDARQTPDRGTIALMVDIASLAMETHVVLRDGLHPSSMESRADIWHERLIAAGFPAESLTQTRSAGLIWLAGDTLQSGMPQTSGEPA